MGENVKVEYSQEPCPKLMLKGQCWQRDSKFSHKSALINNEKNRLIQQWSKQQDQRRPSTQVQQQRVQHKNEDKKQQLVKDPTAANWKRNLSPPAGQKSSDAETHRRVPIMQIIEGDGENSNQQPEEQTDSDAELTMISVFMKMHDTRGRQNVVSWFDDHGEGV